CARGGLLRRYFDVW
nr:immunoglobulin heavy chain junction region [Mus musculus]MBK4186484.1 immunoglobulin heavy chain junction region [Mus musculus]MBK4186485.1 immunoglobulin heavy chain junction region [Mus musculus]